ncbi:MAG: ribose 5-phosphate isomerase A [Candidatus Bathyarchaeia archaeon]
MSWVEGAKRKAVLKALQPIKNGWIIGLGSGSTMAYAVAELARMSKARRLEVSVVPTSHQIENLAISHGLRILSMNEAFTIDYTIDGADQVQLPSLNLIKGGGGALLREKIVDSAARKLAIVVDETKLSKHLGGEQLVPLEVLPFAHKSIQIQVTRIGGRAKLREGAGKIGPVVTDNGNFLLDADFGRIENPARLQRRLKAIPGLLETGLFLNMADIVYVGRQTGEVELLP